MARQQTLTGEPAPARTRPTTMLYCTECDDYVLRSNRFDHPDTHALTEPDESDTNGLPDDCRVNTKTFTVEYTYTCVEHVQVEASDKREARTLADEQRTYDGEYLDTMHTEVEGWGSDWSQATIDYLERVGLLPTDWHEEGEDA